MVLFGRPWTASSASSGPDRVQEQRVLVCRIFSPLFRGPRPRVQRTRVLIRFTKDVSYFCSIFVALRTTLDSIPVFFGQDGVGASYDAAFFVAIVVQCVLLKQSNGDELHAPAAEYVSSLIFGRGYFEYQGSIWLIRYPKCLMRRLLHVPWHLVASCVRLF